MEEWSDGLSFLPREQLTTEKGRLSALTRVTEPDFYKSNPSTRSNTFHHSRFRYFCNSCNSVDPRLAASCKRLASHLARRARD